MYMLPSGLTAAPNNESHGGADRLTCPLPALCAGILRMANTARQTLKKIPICVPVRLRFKLFLPDCGLSSAHRIDREVACRPRSALDQSSETTLNWIL
jgi:hypothetical protein